MRVIALLIFLSCSLTISAQIKISSKKGTDFSKYESFIVQKGQSISLIEDNKIDNNKVYTTLKKKIGEELTSRGYEEKSDSSAHLIISYVYEEADASNMQPTDRKAQVQDPSNIDNVYRSADIERTLIIEIEDRNKNSLWTGNCSLTNLQHDLYSTLEMAITTLFKKFPKR